MIIETGDTPLSFEPYIDTLEDTAARVVRCVKDETDSATCTGWLVTDTLLVLPAFAAPASAAASDWAVFERGNTSPRTAKVVYSNDDSAVHRPAVLRVATPLAVRSHALRLPGLSFNMSRPRIGQRVAVLHYPNGDVGIRLSFGTVVDVDGWRIHHDAPTLPGSGGGPLLDLASLTVIGMHVASDRLGQRNLATATSVILDTLQESPDIWGEVAVVHQMANVAAERSETKKSADSRFDDEVIGSALRWRVKREELSDQAAATLETMVANPASPEWSLTGSSRQQLVAAGGSIDRLRTLRGNVVVRHVGQRAIDRALAGPPFDLADVGDDELPYWLQVTRWFAGVVDGLPKAAEVARELERRRLREPMQRLSGPAFAGREAELRQLQDWYHDDAAGVLSLHGIGGIGKSALVAQFVLSLPDAAPLFWLDFDRADLAPDDKSSVVAVLLEQARIQFDGIGPIPSHDDSWQLAAESLAKALYARARGFIPLVVLDGFEIAQHVERYTEIWTVLRELGRHLPALKVLVSGRAPVTVPVLNDRPAVTLALTGLPEADARDLLAAEGLADPEIVRTVLESARGIPLILRLALRLWQSGGDPRLPETLPSALIDGYLYDRILNRIVDADLQPLARDAIVLRHLTAEMLESILADSVPPGSDARESFARLSREMAVVDEIQALGAEGLSNQTLRIRPELRAATLRLLEWWDSSRVGALDIRAVEWYGAQDLERAEVRAELVYHCLRVGDVDKASRFWRDSLSGLLLDADQEIPAEHEHARDWLRDKLRRLAGVASQQEWETDAYKRIRLALGRGLVDILDDILAERPDRLPSSRLIVYDAWLWWRDGNDHRAKAAVASVNPRTEAGRDCAVLTAWIARKEHNRQDADEALAGVEKQTVWPEGRLAALAVTAARIRLATPVNSELAATENLSDSTFVSGMAEFATSWDPLLPRMSHALDLGLEVVSSPRVVFAPGSKGERAAFRDELDTARRRATGRPVPPDLRLIELDPERLLWSGADITSSSASRELLNSTSDTYVEGRRFGADLAARSVRRWFLASEGTFLRDASALAHGPNPVADPLASAVVGTLGAFGGFPVSVADDAGRVTWSLLEILDGAVGRGLPLVPPQPEGQADISTALNEFTEYHGANRELYMQVRAIALGSTTDVLPPLRGAVRSGVDAALVYLMTPDPLEMLLRRVLGMTII